MRPGETDKEYREYLSLRGDAEKTAEEIRKNGREASLFFGDVGDCGSARALIQYAVDTYGRIDILVNNAAGLGQSTIEETDAASWEKQTRAKLSGAFYTAHYTVPYMQQGFGRILTAPRTPGWAFRTSTPTAPPTPVWWGSPAPAQRS
ncbi:MAG: SDR family oxidoreductase [Firmicutes bacterium]|nr:SDR family oxidoreductase [Bacillota bacterium]